MCRYYFCFYDLYRVKRKVNNNHYYLCSIGRYYDIPNNSLYSHILKERKY